MLWSYWNFMQDFSFFWCPWYMTQYHFGCCPRIHSFCSTHVFLYSSITVIVFFPYFLLHGYLHWYDAVSFEQNSIFISSWYGQYCRIFVSTSLDILGHLWRIRSLNSHILSLAFVAWQILFQLLCWELDKINFNVEINGYSLSLTWGPREAIIKLHHFTWVMCDSHVIFPVSTMALADDGEVMK